MDLQAEDGPKVLVIRLSSIGDIIQCSGVPRCIKSKWPKAKLHWLVRADNALLIANNPHLDQVITLSRQEGFRGLIKIIRLLKREQYTHIYDAHNNLRSNIICWFLNPKYFIRRSKDRLKRFLLFYFRVNLFKDYLPVNSYIDPLSQWDIPNDGEGSDFSIPHETIQIVATKLPSGNPKNRLAIAPSTAWPKKTWPKEFWEDLIRDLLRTTPLQIIILAGPSDTFCQDLILDPERVFSFQGKLTLLESAAAVNLCNTLIAADTGLLHLAESLKKDVIAILGPTPFGDPHRKNSITLRPKIWCSPCSKDGSGFCINKTFQKCMRMTTPDMVAHSLKRILKQNA